MIAAIIKKNGEIRSLLLHSRRFYMGYATRVMKTGLLSLGVLFLFAGNGYAQEDEDGITIGGALRYNFFIKIFEDEDITPSDVQMAWDTWRLNVSGKKAGFLLDFEYRFYPADQAHFIHHGWMGYRWDDLNLQAELGVTQVPFGDLPYASHSWWFSTAYYVGLEDDYDMGIKLDYTIANLDLALAYFIQADPMGVGSTPVAARYSYDIVPVAGASNEERNQVNLRAAYTFDYGNLGNTEIGASGQFGQLYNSAVGDDAWTNRYAAAGHVDATIGQINAKAHVIYYNFEAQDDLGADLDTVIMGAYGYTYGVASQAIMYTVGLAYTLPFEIGPATITIYDDYTFMDKDNDEFEDTQQNTVGALVAAGPIYTYIDFASGYNQPWLRNSFTGLGRGLADDKWTHRFNINLGYYF